MILIPSIDLRAGRCVRLLKGNFDAETRYDLEPHELLLRYRALGATWLHVVDLDGAKDGQLANRSVRSTSRWAAACVRRQWSTTCCAMASIGSSSVVPRWKRRPKSRAGSNVT